LLGFVTTFVSFLPEKRHPTRRAKPRSMRAQSSAVLSGPGVEGARYTVVKGNVKCKSENRG
jgi:hypothetical protein